jgi:nucleotide-binding universal stress UspA family protein
MFKRILVPFDGSVGAAEALRKAVELKKLCDAELLTLTVYRHHSMLEASFSVQRPGDHGNIDDVMRDHAKEIAEAGRALAKEAGAEDAHAFIKSGQPARTIISFAKEHDVDLILLGSRGLGSVEGFLLGSVSHKVTALAECPVMVV